MHLFRALHPFGGKGELLLHTWYKHRKMRSRVLLALFAAASALTIPISPALATNTISRRSLCRIAAGSSAATVAVLTSPLASQADIPPQIIIDINNAGADEFKGLRGLYPTIATKVVQRGPFKTAEDMYKAMDSDVERERLKQYEKQYEFGQRGANDRATANRML